ncbi:DNA-binding protein HU [compost metagenome]
MRKAELVTKLLDRVEGLNADKASKTINAIFEIIAEALEKNDSYSQDKFGTFKVVTRAPRKGRNPKTGETIDIKAKSAVKLVVSSHLKDSVNQENK